MQNKELRRRKALGVVTVQQGDGEGFLEEKAQLGRVHQADGCGLTHMWSSSRGRVVMICSQFIIFYVLLDYLIEFLIIYFIVMYFY